MLHFHSDGILWKLYRENVAFFVVIFLYGLEKRKSLKRVGDYMKIGFIGAGKVGFSLGKYFAEHDVHVSGYYSRNLDSSKEAAIFTKSNYYINLEDIVKESDILFLTVTDSSVPQVYSEILKYDIRGKIIAHCSGAMTSEVFSGISQKGAYGCSIHPICAVNSKETGYQDLSQAYFTIEGEEQGKLAALLKRCGNRTEFLSAEYKIAYHCAAVYASNLVIALYEQASTMLKNCGLSQEFSQKAFLPLFEQNCKNIVKKGTKASLTGPVERGDEETLRKHLSILSPKEKVVYKELSKGLLSLAESKNQERNYDGLQNLLEEG